MHFGSCTSFLQSDHCAGPWVGVAVGLGFGVRIVVVVAVVVVVVVAVGAGLTIAKPSRVRVNSGPEEKMRRRMDDNTSDLGPML